MPGPLRVPPATSLPLLNRAPQAAVTAADAARRARARRLARALQAGDDGRLTADHPLAAAAVILLAEPSGARTGGGTAPQHSAYGVAYWNRVRCGGGCAPSLGSHHRQLPGHWTGYEYDPEGHRRYIGVFESAEAALAAAHARSSQ